MPTNEDTQDRGEEGVGSGSKSGGAVEGYRSLREACRDIDTLVDVVWVSGTRMPFPFCCVRMVRGCVFG